MKDRLRGPLVFWVAAGFGWLVGAGVGGWWAAARLWAWVALMVLGAILLNRARHRVWGRLAG